MVHKLVPKMTAEKQKYSDQKQHVWTKGYYLLGKSAKCHATHHIHYVRYFSWKPYEVGIASDLREYKFQKNKPFAHDHTSKVKPDYNTILMSRTPG